MNGSPSCLENQAGINIKGQDKAASNADPWDWPQAIEKYPHIQTLVDRISEPQW